MENHYSDEDLLSNLDGEVSKHKRRVISQHLEFCWICRARQAELEMQIQTLSSHFQNLQLSPEWNYGTRRKIAAFEKQFENHFQVSKRSVSLGVRRWMFAGGFGLCATAIAFLILRSPVRLIPAPSLIVQKAQEAEVKLTKVPVHEIFSINEIQIRPRGPNRESRLEIWSDGPSRRFASKWTSSNGHLKHAIWDTGAELPFIYASQKLQSSPKSKERKEVIAFAKAEPDLDSVEAQFMRWLEERPWKPIALLPDVSFWEGAGAMMRVERISNQQIRLSVRRKKAGISFEFTAVFGMDNSIPRLQTLKVESAERVVEFQLSSKQIDTSSHFSPVVFYPDHSLEVHLPTPADVTRPMRRTAPMAKTGESPFNSAADIDSAMHAVQAHYILHLAGVCLGASVKVSQEAGGVRVFSESLAGKPRREYFTNEMGVAEMMGALAEIRQSQRQSSPGSEDNTKIVPLVRDADALAMLGNVFNRSVVRKLPPSSLQMLGQMVNDHAANLRDDLANLSATSGSIMDDKNNASGNKEAENWWSAASLLAEKAHRLASSSLSAPEAFQSSLTQVKRIGIQMDELFQKEIATQQRTASLQGIKTGNEK